MTCLSPSPLLYHLGVVFIEPLLHDTNCRSFYKFVVWFYFVSSSLSTVLLCTPRSTTVLSLFHPCSIPVLSLLAACVTLTNNSHSLPLSAVWLTCLCQQRIESCQDSSFASSPHAVICDGINDTVHHRAHDEKAMATVMIQHGEKQTIGV